MTRGEAQEGRALRCLLCLTLLSFAVVSLTRCDDGWERWDPACPLCDAIGQENIDPYNAEPREPPEPLPDPDEVAAACDPDGVAPCPEVTYLCQEFDDGYWYCTSSEGWTPDGGEWACSVDGHDVLCVGDHLPDGGGEGHWECQEFDESIHCTSQLPVPASGADGVWECAFIGDLISCELVPPGGSSRGGCHCIPGAVRYCDTPSYCRWGLQACNEAGDGWGDCVETTTIPQECSGASVGTYYYSSAAERCCVEHGFCCQDFWDIDGDGNRNESLGDCSDAIRCPGGEL